MNTPTMPERTDGPTGRRAVVGRLAAAVERELPPGDLADLRRLRPEEPSSPAFWRVCATYLSNVLPSGEARDEVERRWAALLGALATLPGLHRPGRPLGRALAEAGLSELRFARLLRARGAGLYDAARAVVHFLAQAAEPADLSQLADLLLDQEGDRAESVRRHVARAYYAVQQDAH